MRNISTGAVTLSKLRILPDFFESSSLTLSDCMPASPSQRADQRIALPEYDVR